MSSKHTVVERARRRRSSTPTPISRAAADPRAPSGASSERGVTLAASALRHQGLARLLRPLEEIRTFFMRNRCADDAVLLRPTSPRLPWALQIAPA